MSLKGTEWVPAMARRSKELEKWEDYVKKARKDMEGILSFVTFELFLCKELEDMDWYATYHT